MFEGESIMKEETNSWTNIFVTCPTKRNNFSNIWSHEIYSDPRATKRNIVMYKCFRYNENFEFFYITAR